MVIFLCSFPRPAVYSKSMTTEPPDDILQRWRLTAEELTQIVDENPSMRGLMLGYIAEFQVRKIWLEDNRISDVLKYDDHDRTKKGDLAFRYKGERITLEVKSLQSTTVKQDGDTFTAKFQCDASDRRKVQLPNGEELETTCLVVGEFDLLAVSLFGFKGDWVFAFAKNSDLPRSKYRRYTEEQRQYLLSSGMPITWPIEPPYRIEPFSLLDEIVEER